MKELYLSTEVSVTGHRNSRMKDAEVLFTYDVFQKCSTPGSYVGTQTGLSKIHVNFQ